MPNIKSAEKRVKTSTLRRLQNRAKRSALKTTEKRFTTALNTEVEKAKELLPLTMKKIDKAAAAGVIHKKTAARKKSRLMKKMNAAQTANM